MAEISEERRTLREIIFELAERLEAHGGVVILGDEMETISEVKSYGDLLA